MNAKGKHFLAGALLAVIGASAIAQIVQKTEAYVEKPKLPFTPKHAPAPAPVLAAAPAPPVVAPPQKSWEIRVNDIHLATTFHRWAAEAGYRVRWDAAKHVLIEAPDTVRGSFETALQQVLESPGIAKGTYPLEVCIYPNTPPLARITRKGEQDKECQ